MPAITDDIAANDPAKIYLLGDTGAGKTGAKAALVAAGYKLRIIDTDKGIKILRSLLMDPRYPYNKVIKAKGIDLEAAISYIPINIPMGLRTVVQKDPSGKITSETLLAPKDAKAWQQVIDLLGNWKDGERNYGAITTWESDVVLDFDSFSTLAMMGYYYIQSLNNRLGAREEGYDFQRDVGSAQSQLRRLLEMIHSSDVKCNAIVTTHIVQVDTSGGVIQSPEQRSRAGKPVDAKGMPAAIGRALSSNMGKFVNDIYIVEQTGSGTSVKRTINTVPVGNTSSKKSVFLEPSYSVETGLAEIFAALRGQPHPTELINAIRGTGASAPKPVVPLAQTATRGS